MDLSGVSFVSADALTVAGLVLTGVALLWGAKKAISFGNKG